MRPELKDGQVAVMNKWLFALFIAASSMMGSVLYDALKDLVRVLK